MSTLHRGKLATNPRILSVRPLVRDDLLCLREKRPAQGVVKTFRDSHHRVARLIASGLRKEEVLLRSGYTATRVAQLQDSPAFQELIAAYREKVNTAFVEGVGDYFEVATSNMLKAEVMIADKLDAAIDGDELLPTKDLLAISRDAADRFGFPKQKVNQNNNVNVDFAAMLEATAKRSGRSNVIDAAPMRTVSGPQVQSPPASRPVAYNSSRRSDAGATPAATQVVVPGSSNPERRLVPTPTPSVAGIRRRA